MSYYKNQVSGFTPRPIARNTDPVTSHQAAQHMKDSGKLEGQCAHVLDLVKRYPHCTALELSGYTDLDRHQVQKRLSDLANIGKVKASAVGRKCSKSGRSACTWSVD